MCAFSYVAFALLFHSPRAYDDREWLVNPNLHSSFNPNSAKTSFCVSSWFRGPPFRSYCCTYREHYTHIACAIIDSCVPLFKSATHTYTNTISGVHNCSDSVCAAATTTNYTALDFTRIAAGLLGRPSQYTHTHSHNKHTTEHSQRKAPNNHWKQTCECRFFTSEVTQIHLYTRRSILIARL